MAGQQSPGNTRFRTWADLLWPVGGALLGLLLMPVAIAQYPDFFNENRWLLPASVVIVAFCFIVPLFAHKNAVVAIRWIAGIRWIGLPLSVIVTATLLTAISVGSLKLFRFHTNHLRSVLEKAKAATPAIVKQRGTEGSTGTSIPDKSSPAQSPRNTERYDLNNVTEAIWFGIHVQASPALKDEFKTLDQNTLQIYNGCFCFCVNSIDNFPAGIYATAWQSTFGKVLVCDAESSIASGMSVSVSEHPYISVLIKNRYTTDKCEMEAFVMGAPMTSGNGFVLTAPRKGTWPNQAYILDFPSSTSDLFSLRFFMRSTEIKQLTQGYTPEWKSFALNDPKEVLQLQIFRKGVWVSLELERSLPQKITITTDLLFSGPKIRREYTLTSRIPQQIANSGDSIGVFSWKRTRYAEEDSKFPGY